MIDVLNASSTALTAQQITDRMDVQTGKIILPRMVERGAIVVIKGHGRYLYTLPHKSCEHFGATGDVQ